MSLQIAQLNNLESIIKHGNSMVLDRLSPTATVSCREAQDIVASRSSAYRVEESRNQKRQPLRKFRISLPQCFLECVWEFGLRASNNGWEFQLHPIRTRSRESFVFKVVESGSVPAVRALLESGSLSARDQAVASNSSFGLSLLDVSIQSSSAIDILTLR